MLVKQGFSVLVIMVFSPMICFRAAPNSSAFFAEAFLARSHSSVQHNVQEQTFRNFRHTQSSLYAENSDDNQASSSVDAAAAAADISCETNGIVQVFLDIQVNKEDLGRLVFSIPNGSDDEKQRHPLPLHAENLINLFSGARQSIDPRCRYVGCEFQFSPQFIETFPQYRWAHVLPGRGRHALSAANNNIGERFQDPMNLSQSTHYIYGGTYYGLNFETDIPEDKKMVVLTVPTTGPGRGSSTLTIVRVAESPMEWKERLLLNCAIIGWMEPQSLPILQAMARQTRGPPTVVKSGLL